MAKKRTPTPAAAPAARPFEYSIRATGQDMAEVLIYGDIGDSWFGESVTAKQFADDLKAVADKNLTVRINSYGGSVADGITIYNAIRRHPLQKNVAIDGVAVSIASLIAMAGDRITIAENGLFMIHAPWGAAVGNSQVMREYADVLDRYAEAMSTSYANQTGEPAADMLALLTDGMDHWYTAQEALDAGFVDEIAAAAPSEQAAQYQAAAFARFKVPANIYAHFRLPAAVAASLQTKENPMTVKTPNPATPAAGAEPAVEPSPVNVVQIEQAAAKKERERLASRNAAIDKLYAKFKHLPAIAKLHGECLADPELTVETASARLLESLGEGQGSLVPAGAGIHGGADERDKRIHGRTEALLARLGKAKPDAANPFRGEISLLDLARGCLEAAGVNCRGMGAMDLADAALRPRATAAGNTTSDFPVVLENTLHKLVLTGFDSQPATFPRFTRQGDVADFRAWNRIVPGMIGNLDTVNEAGEYKNKSIPDGQKNPVTATRKGNIIQITPEVLINDDTGYIQNMADGLGRAGMRTIERAVYALIIANGNLSDGVALFHATHANLAGSGAVPSVTTIDSARQALASQKAPGTDAEYLNIVGPFIAVVPLAQGLNTRTIAKAVYDPDTANKLQRPNPVAGLISDVVDSPWLTGTAWYLFADPNVAPVIEVVYLNGQRQPRVVMEENFRTAGLAWRVELPFGVGAVDYRGGYKNPGA